MPQLCQTILVPDVAKREKSCDIKRVPVERLPPSPKGTDRFDLFVSHSEDEILPGNWESIHLVIKPEPHATPTSLVSLVITSNKQGDTLSSAFHVMWKLNDCS